MTRFLFFLLAVVTAVIVAFHGPTPGLADAQSAPYVTEVPQGYRDFQWISSTHEAGNLNSLGAVLGNEVAIKAYREGKASVSGRHDHCCFALPLRPIGGKQQSFWPGSVFRSRRPHEYSVYGQGLNQVRRNRRLGVRSLRGRQTWRRGVHENLLPLPREGQNDRPCFYSLCALISLSVAISGNLRDRPRAVDGFRSCCTTFHARPTLGARFIEWRLFRW